MVRPYIKTTLSPGSGVVKDYFEQADMQDALDKLGFTIAGYGCMTCIIHFVSAPCGTKRSSWTLYRLACLAVSH